MANFSSKTFTNNTLPSRMEVLIKVALELFREKRVLQIFHLAVIGDPHLHEFNSLKLHVFADVMEFYFNLSEYVF